MLLLWQNRNLHQGFGIAWSNGKLVWSTADSRNTEEDYPGNTENMVREHGSSNLSLSELRKCLLQELNVMEAENSIGSQEGRLQPTATFMTNTKQTRVKPSARSQMRSVPEPAKRAGAFCKGPHSSADCTEVTDHDGRINITVKRDHLCFNCLGRHKISDCKSKSKCRNCSCRHHTSLCKGITRKTDEKPQTQATSSKIDNAKEPSTPLQLHSSLAQSHGHVLLKTVMAPLSSGKCLDANILLDEGTQRSFVTTKLADKLELVPSGRETFPDLDKITRKSGNFPPQQFTYRQARNNSNGRLNSTWDCRSPENLCTQLKRHEVPCWFEISPSV